MLQIKDLSIVLREDNRTLLKDFNFVLNAGDRVGLIGEEGNGKSLLLKTIVDREKVEHYCEVKGTIYKRNEIIAYLPQRLSDADLSLTSGQYLLTHLRDIPIDYSKLYKHLDEFHLDKDLAFGDMPMKFLSGGEKIKFALLVELLKEPSLFLLDEPSNDLDYASVQWLEHFMLEMDIPFIFVSHDTALLSKVANKIIHLEQIYRRTEAKHTVSANTYEDYVGKREDFITNETKRARKEQEVFSKKADRYRKVHDSVESALRATKNDIEGKNLKDKMHSVKALGKKLQKEEANLTKEPAFEEKIDIYFDKASEVPNGKVILDFKLDQLKVGPRILSNNIHLNIVGPEKICIVGKNGVGKTTLLKALIKELKSLNLRVGYMPQSYFDFEEENVNAIDYLIKEPSQDERTRISTFLGSLNFSWEEMQRDIHELSGGQKAKLFFAKINLAKAQVLILDEPTRNLSPLSQPEIIEALRNYGGAIIAVSHDRNFIKQVFSTVYELDSEGLHSISLDEGFESGF